MDIFHEGKGDAADDHKFINERLLEVAVPHTTDEGKTVRLEDCLEDYFNTRVEVVRRLERRDTLQRVITDNSVKSGLSTVDEKPPSMEHAETVEDADSSSVTPTVLSPPAPTAPSPATPATRNRSTSIIRHIMVAEVETGEPSASGDTTSVHSSLRKGSLRKEVLMPAWQFFRIIRPSPICFHIMPSIPSSAPENIVLIGNIAWYTAQIPTDDAQVAAHFSSTRPVLGICLKRYAMSSQGQPIRLNTAIDIPLQIALPHFIQDDKATEGGPLFGNFNLVLQSVVCHRGTSVHSGHYISLIRGTSQTKDEDSNYLRRLSADSQLPVYSEDRWIKFDDLASQRVTYVDIEKTMAEEMPYLLFYQVQPLVPDTPCSIEHYNRPPSYEDSGIAMAFISASPVTATKPDLGLNSAPSYFDNAFVTPDEFAKGRISFSDDIDHPRKSLNLPESDFPRRGSLATETSTVSLPSAPMTPAEEGPAPSSRLSRATSRFGRRGGADSKSKSRPSSHADEHRISATFSRLSLISNKSKELLNKSQDASTSEIASSAASAENIGGKEVSTANEVIKDELRGSGKLKESDSQQVHQHFHHTQHRGRKSKDATQDRECAVM
jgi:Ubiquitin carboxyl-terminal hydrolase